MSVNGSFKLSSPEIIFKFQAGSSRDRLHSHHLLIKKCIKYLFKRRGRLRRLQSGSHLPASRCGRETLRQDGRLLQGRSGVRRRRGGGRRLRLRGVCARQKDAQGDHLRQPHPLRLPIHRHGRAEMILFKNKQHFIHLINTRSSSLARTPVLRDWNTNAKQQPELTVSPGLGVLL